MKRPVSLFLALLLIVPYRGPAQISPGPLASVHSHLEGLSNCTQCHDLGNRVTDAKCLACHTEVKARLDQGKGYHASPEVKGKQCVACHNDHHGLNFQIVRFNKESFNHSVTGFRLTGAHALKACVDCHKPGHISNPPIRKKKFTYLGLNQACLTCHTDYHQKTLSQNCSSCHTMDAFRPAPGFSHSSARFQLHGMHGTVQCVKCHPVTTRNGEKFQQFNGLRFSNCNACHSDPHQGRFGQECKSCHDEQSFLRVKGISNFDHSRTGFPLENKHRSVLCSACHKTNLTDPLKYDRCLDCHKDYHEGEFNTDGQPQDCSPCHTTTGFANFLFTIEQHNAGPFPLEGAHLATPCNACHKKTERWNFRDIGNTCTDCHKDIHTPHISPQYYPGGTCQQCHVPSAWNNVTFDHTQTGWDLTGAHATRGCRDCHYRQDASGNVVQQFSSLTSNCTSCHDDRHNGQFNEGGATDCLRCHDPNYWQIAVFDHSKTAFKLDGKHAGVPCGKCHKPQTEGEKTYVLYKLKDTRCESCH